MIEIRHASTEDADTFVELWSDLLQSLEKKGGDVPVTDKSLAFYRALFMRCVEGETLGAALLAFDGSDPVGVLLWCEAGESPLDTPGVPSVFGWGAYTRPSHRRAGVSRSLRESAILHLYELGVAEVAGSVLLSNTAGVESSRAVGFRPTQLLGVLDVVEQTDRITGHHDGEGNCVYGYTDGFYTEGECPLCGHEGNKGEQQ